MRLNTEQPMRTDICRTGWDDAFETDLRGFTAPS